MELTLLVTLPTVAVFLIVFVVARAIDSGIERLEHDVDAVALDRPHVAEVQSLEEEAR